jgi:ribonuclease P/MRP protein subunit RPP1
LTTDSIHLLQENLRQLICASWTFNGYSNYDVIAVRPLHDHIFRLSCRNTIIRVISIDLTKRLTLKLKPNIIRNALRRNIMFEFCVAPALRSNIARRNFFSNIRVLLRAINADNIVLANGSNSKLDLRTPCEMISIAKNLGMNPTEAKKSLKFLPLQCLQKRLLTRHSLWEESAKIDSKSNVLTFGIKSQKIFI